MPLMEKSWNSISFAGAGFEVSNFSLGDLLLELYLVTSLIRMFYYLNKINFDDCSFRVCMTANTVYCFKIHPYQCHK